MSSRVKRGTLVFACGNIKAQENTKVPRYARDDMVWVLVCFRLLPEGILQSGRRKRAVGLRFRA